MDGSRPPGRWRARRVKPFLPRPVPRPFARSPSTVGGCCVSASPGAVAVAVAGGAGARGMWPVHVHWQDHKALEPHPVYFYQTICSLFNTRN